MDMMGLRIFYLSISLVFKAPSSPLLGYPPLLVLALERVGVMVLG